MRRFWRYRCSYCQVVTSQGLKAEFYSDRCWFQTGGHSESVKGCDPSWRYEHKRIARTVTMPCTNGPIVQMLVTNVKSFHIISSGGVWLVVGRNCTYKWRGEPNPTMRMQWLLTLAVQEQPQVALRPQFRTNHRKEGRHATATANCGPTKYQP